MEIRRGIGAPPQAQPSRAVLMFLALGDTEYLFFPSDQYTVREAKRAMATIQTAVCKRCIHPVWRDVRVGRVTRPEGLYLYKRFMKQQTE